jgi:hypothetical protein
MASDEQGPVEHDLIKNAALADVTVAKVDITPTSTGDRHVRIEGQLGDAENPDAEWAAFGFIYAIGLLSFHDARPRGMSDIDYHERDEWTAADMLRRLRYERGRLEFDSDYVRGRMMKTEVTIRPDGSFTLQTTNRGEVATRWVGRLQGKKVLAPVVGEGQRRARPMGDDREDGSNGNED